VHIRDVAKKYVALKHPEVVSGRLSADAIFFSFFDGFRKLCTTTDGYITYVTSLSCMLDVRCPSRPQYENTGLDHGSVVLMCLDFFYFSWFECNDEYGHD